jgi:hypothetical protein
MSYSRSDQSGVSHKYRLAAFDNRAGPGDLGTWRLALGRRAVGFSLPGNSPRSGEEDALMS